MQEIEQIIQQRTFKHVYLKADINLYYTSSQLLHYRNKLLRPFGLSIQQFNILRILKGMRGEPSSIKSIQSKMIDKMSNASRLVDKLKAKKFVTRVECPVDRRKVEIKITPKGLSTVDEASEVLESKTKHIYADLSEEEAQQLNHILNKIRIY